MTATNHAITAANLALVTKQWWVLPIAFASHYALDALPHYGDPVPWAKGARYKTILVADIIMFAILLWLAIMTAGAYLWLVIAAMIASCLPDLVWFYRDYLEHKEGVMPQANKLTHFHAHIQKNERDWGWIVEIGWFIGMLAIYAGLVATG